MAVRFPKKCVSGDFPETNSIAEHVHVTQYNKITVCSFSNTWFSRHNFRTQYFYENANRANVALTHMHVGRNKMVDLAVVKTKHSNFR